jgi:hypothetical protein
MVTQALFSSINSLKTLLDFFSNLFHNMKIKLSKLKIIPLEKKVFISSNLASSASIKVFNKISFSFQSLLISNLIFVNIIFNRNVFLSLDNQLIFLPIPLLLYLSKSPNDIFIHKVSL